MKLQDIAPGKVCGFTDEWKATHHGIDIERVLVYAIFVKPMFDVDPPSINPFVGSIYGNDEFLVLDKTVNIESNLAEIGIRVMVCNKNSPTIGWIAVTTNQINEELIGSFNFWQEVATAS